MHVNPCFHQTANEDWKVVAQNNSIFLKNGDKFSLLQDSFQYYLEIIEEHAADGIDLKVQENEKLSGDALDGNQSENKTSAIISPQKKVARPLPVWMNESATSPKRQTDNKEVRKKKQKMELHSPSKENASSSVKCDVGNEKKLSSESGATDSDLKTGSVNEDKDCNVIRTAENKHAISDDEDDTGSVSVKETTNTSDSEKDQSLVNTKDVSSNASVRQPCKYGQGCYRYNKE